MKTKCKLICLTHLFSKSYDKCKEDKLNNSAMVENMLNEYITKTQKQGKKRKKLLTQ